MGLVRALLQQQEVQKAADAVSASLAAAPNSPALITLRGEVELRQGEPWTAINSASQSIKLDPCNPRTHFLIASIDEITSHHAAAQQEILIARQIDPEDPEIRAAWMMILPMKQRIAEIEDYLAAPRGDGAEDSRHLHEQLDQLKELAVEPQKPCRLVSQIASTEIPFAPLMADATHIKAFGLEAKLNNRTARLQIDTGAGGLVVSRSVARRAGLIPFSQAEQQGIGDRGSNAGFTAYANSIRIGGLEFQNCPVKVLDNRGTLGVDGLIGMDVFSKFLVTLDYPMRKLILGPLPPRPNAANDVASELNMDEEDSQAGQETPAWSDQPSAETMVSGATGSTAPSKPPKPVPASGLRGHYDRNLPPELKDYTPVLRVGHDLIVPALLNGQKLTLMIMDTGSWATTISPLAAREVTSVHRDRSIHVEGIGGQVDKVYTANEVTIRFSSISQRLRDVVSFDTSRVSRSVGMEISGFLGAATLNQLTIHIDYRDGLVKCDYDPNRGYKF